HKNSNGHKRMMKLNDHYETVKELHLANDDVLIFYLWRTPTEKLLYNEEERKELFTNIMR
ncbi:MAG: hypothetical protein QW390_00400, partial [Candidatus Bathyarchaeia archaeon]